MPQKSEWHLEGNKETQREWNEEKMWNLMADALQKDGYFETAEKFAEENFRR
jgi:hypothetical protein